MNFVFHQAMKSGMKPQTALQKATKGTKMCSAELGALQASGNGDGCCTVSSINSVTSCSKGINRPMPDKQLNEVSPMLRERYEHGRGAMRQANWDYAMSIVTQVLRQEPGFWECRAALRECHAKNAANGSHPLERFLAWATHWPRLALGKLALSRRPLCAIRAADWVLVREPASGSALSLLGEAALNADFPITAAQALEMVYKRAPKNKRVALWFGEALARAGFGWMLQRERNSITKIFCRNKTFDSATTLEWKHSNSRTVDASGG
jgi:hypothetical protein